MVTKGTKMDTIRQMLCREEGCTSAEVRAAVGWPSVSIPQRAEQLGITKLYVLKIGNQTRYWAIPPNIKERYL